MGEFYSAVSKTSNLACSVFQIKKRFPGTVTEVGLALLITDTVTDSGNGGLSNRGYERRMD